MLPRARFAVLLATAVATAAGCAAPEDETNEDGTATGAAVAAVTRTVCFSGRSFESDPYSVGGAADLGRLCEGLPNLVRDRGGRDEPYPFFRWDTDLDRVVDVIVGVLDTNHDGVVDNVDAPADLLLVGYSWGGYNARDVAKKIDDDRRFSRSRKKVARFVALDPYRTDALIFRKAWLDVPPNVVRFYELRHTVAPEDDCSRVVPHLVGPFTGRDPRCTGTTECHDYDYSKVSWGEDVDHCDVPYFAAGAVSALTRGESPSGLPPEVPVPRY